jgi:hypothetical protein
MENENDYHTGVRDGFMIGITWGCIIAGLAVVITYFLTV